MDGFDFDGMLDRQSWGDTLSKLMLRIFDTDSDHALSDKELDRAGPTARKMWDRLRTRDFTEGLLSPTHQPLDFRNADRGRLLGGSAGLLALNRLLRKPRVIVKSGSLFDLLKANVNQPMTEEIDDDDAYDTDSNRPPDVGESGVTFHQDDRLSEELAGMFYNLKKKSDSVEDESEEDETKDYDNFPYVHKENLSHNTSPGLNKSSAIDIKKIAALNFKELAKALKKNRY